MTFSLRGYAGLPIENAHTQEDAEGAIAVWTRRQLAVTRVHGKMTVVRARIIEDASSSMRARGEKYSTFHDWEELGDYEIEARLRLVALGVRFRDLATAHLLVRSRVIVAAVEAAGILVRNMIVYKTRSAFEAELSTKLRGPR